MSIVKYTNKKTGVVTLYESTSHYDPETKQSRPVRKYLGREDPITGELIPSSRKRGRKKDTLSDVGKAPETSDDTAVSILKARYENELAARDETIREQAAVIKKLEAQKGSLVEKLSYLLQELTD
jgi:hypothetical protein